MLPCYDPVISANDLNHDLNIIHQWAHQWKMLFNPDHTKHAAEVIFSSRKFSPHHLVFNGTVAATNNEQKHLEKRLNEKIIKAKKNISG